MGYRSSDEEERENKDRKGKSPATTVITSSDSSDPEKSEDSSGSLGREIKKQNDHLAKVDPAYGSLKRMFQKKARKYKRKWMEEKEKNRELYEDNRKYTRYILEAQSKKEDVSTRTIHQASASKTEVLKQSSGSRSRSPTDERGGASGSFNEEHEKIEKKNLIKLPPNCPWSLKKVKVKQIFFFLSFKVLIYLISFQDY
jgi:hypothetical protein